MTVIPASSLSHAEMQMLGNNVTPRRKGKRRRKARHARPLARAAALGSTHRNSPAECERCLLLATALPQP
jgi:hypothetical protein